MVCLLPTTLAKIEPCPPSAIKDAPHGYYSIVLKSVGCEGYYRKVTFKDPYSRMCSDWEPCGRRGNENHSAVRSTTSSTTTTTISPTSQLARGRRNSVAPPRTSTRAQQRVSSTTRETTPVATPYVHQCPQSTEEYNLVYKERCVSDGLVVQQHKVTGTPCWDTTAQEKTCSCRNWTTTCTHSQLEAPKVFGTQKDILKAAELKICATRPGKPLCSGTPTKTLVGQIELFDGSTKLVKGLAIQWMQISVQDKPQCVGSGFHTTGTAAYCGTHQCSPYSTKFCYFATTEIPYLMNAYGKLPLRAFGMVSKDIYSFRLPPEHEHDAAGSSRPTFRRLQQLSGCLECHLQCVKGGFHLRLADDVQFVESCIDLFCYRLSFPGKDITLPLPQELSLVSHSIKARIWVQGKVVKTLSSVCQPHPFCDQINCYFCAVRLRNLHCHSTLLVVVVVVCVYFISMLALLLYMVCRGISVLLSTTGICVYYSLKCCWRLTKMMKNKAYRKTVLPFYHSLSDETMVDYHSSTARWPSRHRAKITLAVIVVALISSSSACSSAPSLVAHEASCTVAADRSKQCVIDEVTRVLLSPLGQPTCLLIETEDRNPIGTLELRLESISFDCIKNSQYFTRSYVMKPSYSKRCYGAGTCKLFMKCTTLSPDAKLPEFSAVNHKPGFTHCSRSCGGLFCGCLLENKGCSFYRVYAEETEDKTPYEVFDCSGYQQKTILKAKLRAENRTDSTTLVMNLGQETFWHEVAMSFTTTATELPLMPLLMKTFLSGGNRTSIIHASAPGQGIVGTIGHLQCKSKEQADGFNGCTLSSDPCKCKVEDKSHHDSLYCKCTSGSLEKVLTKKENMLPLAATGVTLFPSAESGITAKFQAASSQLEVQVKIAGFKVQTQIDQALCKVSPTSLSGCYSCIAGATLEFSCTTDYGEALAHIDCGPVKFSAHCTSVPKNQRTTLVFQKPEQNLECDVLCPGGSTTFPLEVKDRYYVEAIDLFEEQYTEVAGNQTSDYSWVSRIVSAVDPRNWRMKVFGPLLNWFSDLRSVLGIAKMVAMGLAIALVVGLLIFVTFKAAAFVACLRAIVAFKGKTKSH